MIKQGDLVQIWRICKLLNINKLNEEINNKV